MADHEFTNNDNTDFSDASSDSSFEDELLQDFQRNVAVGYRYEPYVDASDASETESSDSEIDVPQQQENRVGNTNWCTCGNCVIMPTDMESTCCKELPKVYQKMESVGLDIPCIGEHPDLDRLILDPGVLGLAAINSASMWRTNLPSPLTDT